MLWGRGTVCKMHPRRQAREMILQALYAQDITRETPDKIINDIINRYNPEKDVVEFITSLFNIIIEKKEWTESIISRFLENWDFDRVARLDKLILRLAICELYFQNDVPGKVSIAEAIEIAKQYSTEESSSFVNGILDSVYKQYKQKENK